MCLGRREGYWHIGFTECIICIVFQGSDPVLDSGGRSSKHSHNIMGESWGCLLVMNQAVLGERVHR